MKQTELDKIFDEHEKRIAQMGKKRDRYVKWALIFFVFSQLMGFVAAVLLILSD